MVSVKKSKKGVTLAELTVVMAIVAIMATCVVSFTVLINSHVGRITRVQDIQTDLDRVALVADRWCARFDSAAYDVGVGADGTLIATPVNPDPDADPEAEPVAYTLRFSLRDHQMVGTLDDGSPIAMPLTAVTAVRFRLQETDGIPGSLLHYTVVYEQLASITGMPITKQQSFMRCFRIAQ